MQQVKTLPREIISKLRRMEIEIREILDFYDMNRTYYISGNEKDLKILGRALNNKSIPFNEVKVPYTLTFEPEVYNLVENLVRTGQEKGKIGIVNIHQNDEIVNPPEIEEDEVNVYKEMYDFLKEFKAGRGHKENVTYCIKQLDELYEENEFTKKIKKVKNLLEELANSLVINGDNLVTLKAHFMTCGIKWEE